MDASASPTKAPRHQTQEPFEADMRLDSHAALDDDRPEGLEGLNERKQVAF